MTWRLREDDIPAAEMAGGAGISADLFDIFENDAVSDIATGDWAPVSHTLSWDTHGPVLSILLKRTT